MACFTCGKSFSKSTNEVILKYKKEFKNLGIERYVYKLSPKDPIMIVKKKYFNDIFNNKIKPKIKEGAEYFHISEYTGN